MAPVLGAAVREGPGCAGVGREDGMDLCVTAAAQPLQRRGHRGSRWDGGARSGGWHQPVAAGKDRMRKYVGCSLRCHGCAGRTGRAAQSATDATEV